MARTRRLSFAAPFVVVVAAGCSSKDRDPEPPPTGSGAAPGQTWTIERRPGGGCEVRTLDDCPPGKNCNPPAPLRFPCPAAAPAGTFTITTLDHQTCHLGDTATVVPCPGAEPIAVVVALDAAVAPSLDAAAAIARRRWDVRRKADACFANEDACSGVTVAAGAPMPPCNPPPPIKIACPPPAVVAIVEIAPDRCAERAADATAPTGAVVPCPHW